MRLKPYTRMILIFIVLLAALVGMLFQREMQAQLMPNPMRWKAYHNDFLNVRLLYPGAWIVDDSSVNEQNISSLIETKQALAMIQAKTPDVRALPIGTVTFSPIKYDQRACGSKRLSECPGFASAHSAVITLQVFYEPLETVSKGGHPQRHSPYDVLVERQCSYTMTTSFSRNDIDHVFTMCVDWKDGLVSKAQQNIIQQQYQALFDQFYNTFDYLRTPTI